MNRMIMLLGVVLVIQVVIAVIANTGDDSLSAFTPQERLFTFSPDEIDNILVEADDKTAIDLRRENGIWTIPELNHFPADQKKINGLLEKLVSFRKGWPVATTTSSARRFKVADDDFVRKIVLQKAGEKAGELYLGTSPGFRKIHARTGNEDSIYSIDFNTFEAESNSDSWIKKDILKIDRDKITSITLNDFKLIREAETMVLDGISEDEDMNTDEVNSLIDKMSNMTIQSVLGFENRPEYQQDTPGFSYTISLEDGTGIDYRFSRPEDEVYHVLKTSKHEYYFKIPEWQVKPIMDMTRARLVRMKDAPEPEKQDGDTIPHTDDATETGTN